VTAEIAVWVFPIGFGTDFVGAWSQVTIAFNELVLAHLTFRKSELVVLKVTGDGVQAMHEVALTFCGENSRFNEAFEESRRHEARACSVGKGKRAESSTIVE